jgi:superfamily II DNA or RNA helicase
MIVLNPDQQDAVAFFKRWWNSDRRFAILEGAAGTGKTTIVQHLVKDLANCDPLFTAPTNEACKQLENTLPAGSLIKTTYSALGFHFNSSSEVKALGRHGGLPTVINDINLLIIDECSMVGKELLEAIEETGKKTLFIGH